MCYVRSLENTTIKYDYEQLSAYNPCVIFQIHYYTPLRLLYLLLR
jgi:hypothetical protein